MLENDALFEGCKKRCRPAWRSTRAAPGSRRGLCPGAARDDEQRARQLRKSMTDAEQALWTRLRRRQVHGHKFRRQHPLGGYIVDFVCLDEKLVVEVDGGQHDEQRDEDALRTLCLEQRGFRVMRFWNHQVLGELDAVTEAIAEALCPPPAPDCGAASPRGGRHKRLKTQIK
jgi:very-short-patch-repair endonuclease